VMSLAAQTYAFLMTILAGAVVGLLFDLYRVLRAACHPRQWVTALTDIVFWIAVTPIVFAMLLAGNWGELRYYVLIGLGVGLLLYFQTLSSLVIWAFAGALRGFGRLLGSVLFGFARLILYPLHALGRALGWRPGAGEAWAPVRAWGFPPFPGRCGPSAWRGTGSPGAGSFPAPEWRGREGIEPGRGKV